MNTSARARVPKYRPPALRIWREPASESPAVVWRINGYRASLLVWTPDEWARMDARPADAQYHPSGVWCALRME
jgi:hypothetical protein